MATNAILYCGLTPNSCKALTDTLVLDAAARVPLAVGRALFAVRPEQLVAGVTSERALGAVGDLPDGARPRLHPAERRLRQRVARHLYIVGLFVISAHNNKIVSESKKPRWQWTMLFLDVYSQ